MSPDCLIPRHVTGLYVFTVVNLLALLQFSVVNGDVTVYDSFANETINYFYDLSATFGGRLSEDGITGYLIPVKPTTNSTCEYWNPAPPFNKSQSANFIALIERNGICKFDEMVYGAQKLGYICVIIYNSEGDEGLVHMGGSKVASKVIIPSVFVGWTDGRYLRDYQYKRNGRYKVTVNKRPDLKPYLLWPFAVVVGTCFILMIVFMVFKWIRGIRRKKRSRLSTKLLKKIPTKKFKKGDAYDVCAICLDDYEEKDKLRILPCNHAYHCKCIDPWLTKNKKTCPVCKRKVIPGAKSESESDSDEDDNGNETSTERTPLLAPGNSNRIMTTPRRSTFDESGLPENVRSQLAQVNELLTPPIHNRVLQAESRDGSSTQGAYGTIPSSQVVVTAGPSRKNEELVGINNGYSSSSSDDYSEDEPDYSSDDDHVTNTEEVQVVVQGTENGEEEKKLNHVV